MALAAILPIGPLRDGLIQFLHELGDARELLPRCGNPLRVAGLPANPLLAHLNGPTTAIGRGMDHHPEPHHLLVGQFVHAFGAGPEHQVQVMW